MCEAVECETCIDLKAATSSGLRAVQQDMENHRREHVSVVSLQACSLSVKVYTEHSDDLL